MPLTLKRARRDDPSKRRANRRAPEQRKGEELDLPLHLKKPQLKTNMTHFNDNRRAQVTLALSCRRILVSVGMLCLLTLNPQVVLADAWPSRPVRFIVSFPPGNSADLIARTFGNALAERLGQAVVIENRGGAGGAIGVEALTKAVPDGYTFGVSSLSPITIMPAVQKTLPYDPIQGLVPVTLLGKGPLFLLVRKDSTINSIKDLVAQSQANPGKLTYGSLGPGTVSQMSTEVFKAASGANLTEISYKGSNQALTDLIGGHITLMLDGAASATVQIHAGTVKALAVTTLKRSTLMPDILTLSETGIASLNHFDLFGWIGVFAPLGTPTDIVTRLQTELSTIGLQPTVIKQVNTAGLDVPEPNTSAQFAEFLKQDLARWTKVATDLKISVQ